MTSRDLIEGSCFRYGFRVAGGRHSFSRWPEERQYRFNSLEIGTIPHTSINSIKADPPLKPLFMPRPRGRPPRQPTASRATPQKRTLSPTTQLTSTSTPSRQSKRLKSTPVSTPATKATPQKSPFFHPDPEPDPDSGSDSDISEEESAIEDEASRYEDEDGSEDGAIEDDEDEDEDEDATPSSEDDGARKRKGKRKKPGRKVMITSTKSNGKKINHLEKGESENENEYENENGRKEKKGQELWRPGVKSKLAPGEAMWIPLPKARGAGKTPYQDHTVHPNTMAFLGELKENNEREWLKGTPCASFLPIFFVVVEAARQRRDEDI